MPFSQHIRSAQASARTIRYELGLRRSADPPSGKAISARLRYRQQPVDATEDLIEKCPVIVLHSQHHLTGMTGDPTGHGEKTVTHCDGHPQHMGIQTLQQLASATPSSNPAKPVAHRIGTRNPCHPQQRQQRPLRMKMTDILQTPPSLSSITNVFRYSLA